MSRAPHTPTSTAPPSFRPLGDEDDRESGAFNVSNASVLVLLRPGDDVPAVHQALAGMEQMFIEIASVPAPDALAFIPRLAIVEIGAVPEALGLVRRLADPPHEALVLAVVRGPEEESAALAAGAAAVVRRPLRPLDVALHLKRFRRQHELVAQSRELFQRSEETALVSMTARVTAAICHEVRNPLQGVRLNLSLLQESQDRAGPRLSFDERREVLSDIDRSLTRVEAVLTTLSGLARGDKPELRELDLVEVARESLGSVRGGGTEAIELAVGDPVVALGARSLVHQVVVNVINNALDAVRGLPSPKVIVRVYATATEARLSVRDNGPGVPPGLRDRIFEPFFSTKGSGGSGLGLAISRQLVGTMGGALTLSGEPPPGACFRIRLRRA